MSNLDWQSDKAYNFTEDLDDKGWAWEFIRRSPAYRAAYAETLAHVHEKYGSWENQPITSYRPERLENESPRQWMLRADENGQAARELTSSAARALDPWFLYDMYDPTLQYAPDKIAFDLYNPFPTFFSPMADSKEDTPSEKNRQWLCDLHEKMKGKIHRLRPIEELDSPNGFSIDDNVVLVAFDIRRPLPAQLEKARIFLGVTQDHADLFEREGNKRRDKGRLYLRILDALDSAPDLSQAEMLRRIQPAGSPGALDYETAAPKAVTDRASSMIRQAQNMTETGYKRLLFSIEYEE